MCRITVIYWYISSAVFSFVVLSFLFQVLRLIVLVNVCVDYFKTLRPTHSS